MLIATLISFSLAHAQEPKVNKEACQRAIQRLVEATALRQRAQDAYMKWDGEEQKVFRLALYKRVQDRNAEMNQACGLNRSLEGEANPR